MRIFTADEGKLLQNPINGSLAEIYIIRAMNEILSRVR